MPKKKTSDESNESSSGDEKKDLTGKNKDKDKKKEDGNSKKSGDGVKERVDKKKENNKEKVDESKDSGDNDKPKKPPPKKQKEKRKIKDESSGPEGDEESQTSEGIRERRKKGNKEGGGKSGGDNLKKSSLKRSKKWDEEDLEVIQVLEDSGEKDKSDSDSDVGDDKKEGDDGVQLDFFSFMPDEVILNVYSYLDEPGLGKVAQVCDRWNKLTFDEDLWQGKSSKWFYIPKAQFAANKTKQFFVQKYQEQKNREKTQRDLEERQRKDARRKRQATIYKLCLRYLFFNRIADYVSVISLIMGTIFVAAKLDHAVDWSWRATLVPFYILMFQFVLAIPSFDLGRRVFDTVYITDRPGKQKHIVWQFLFCEFRKYRPLIYSIIFCLLLFFILLMIKLNGTPSEDGLPSGVVMIPLFLLIAIVFQAPITGCFRGRCSRADHKWDRFVMSSSMCGPFFILLFMALKMDNVVDWPWPVVLIPMWVLLILIVCTPICMLFARCCCCRNWCEDNSNFMDDPWVLFWLCGMCWIFLLVPFLVWVVLMATNFDDSTPGADRPFKVVFVPIFIVESILLGACIIGDIIYFCCR